MAMEMHLLHMQVDQASWDAAMNSPSDWMRSVEADLGPFDGVVRGAWPAGQAKGIYVIAETTPGAQPTDLMSVLPPRSEHLRTSPAGSLDDIVGVAPWDLPRCLECNGILPSHFSSCSWAR